MFFSLTSMIVVRCSFSECVNNIFFFYFTSFFIKNSKSCFIVRKNNVIIEEIKKKKMTFEPWFINQTITIFHVDFRLTLRNTLYNIYPWLITKTLFLLLICHLLCRIDVGNTVNSLWQLTGRACPDKKFSENIYIF